MEELRPIFEDLSDLQLLRKCLHGKTQNPNESVNHVIWTKLPKTVFVSLPKLKTGVYLAIADFNDGRLSVCRVLEAAGIRPGPFCVSTMEALDLKRIRRAECNAGSAAKKSRLTNRRLKKRQDDILTEMEQEDPPYAAGAH